MREFIKKYDIITKTISVIIAIVLWVFVISVENPNRTLEFSSIPITIVGQEDILNAYNLSIIEGADTLMSVKLSAKNNIITKLTNSQIKAYVDVSDINTAGTYDIPINVLMPSTFIIVKSQTPATAKITLDSITSKQVPVRVNFKAPNDKNYVYAEPILIKNYVTIQGPNKMLSDIDFALVTPKPLTHSSTANYEYTLNNKDGKTITNKYIKKIDKMVEVNINVLKIKEIPLSVNISNDISQTEFTAQIIPTTVKIIGETINVDKVDKIILGDVSKDKTKYSFKIQYPAIVQAYDKNLTRATVEIKHIENTEIPTPPPPPPEPPVTPPVDNIDKIENVVIKDILISDTNPQPDKSIELITTSIIVEFSGKDAKTIKEGDITASATVDSLTLTKGGHKIPLNIILPEGKEIKIVGSYEIEIEVK